LLIYKISLPNQLVVPNLYRVQDHGRDLLSHFMASHMMLWLGSMFFLVHTILVCCNPSFGFEAKTRACKGEGQDESPGVTSHVPKSVGECEGMNPHTPKWLAL
jgi:hypothetical protein